MDRTIGANIQELRTFRAWTQAWLAEISGVDVRTIQRAEKGQRPSLDTLDALAKAFDVPVSKLIIGTTLEDAETLRSAFTCFHCGAELVERTFVDHEYGDTEFEQFACGATHGWRVRPCPKSSDFPSLEDYKLTYITGDLIGEVHCLATGQTDGARAVDLEMGRGRSEAEARKWVERSYILARHGSDEAEAFLPYMAGMEARMR